MKKLIYISLFLSTVIFSQSPDTLYPVHAFTANGYKYGYINRDGNLVIQAKYDFAKDFSEGLAFVKSDNKSDLWDCINTSGEKVFGINAKYVYDFKYGYAGFIGLNDSDFFLSSEGIIYPGKFIFEPDIGVRKLHPFSNGDKWGYREGNYIGIIPQYKRAGEFSEGLAPVFIKFSEADLPEDNCYNAFINIKGDIVLRTELKYNDNGYLVTGYFYSPGMWQNGVCRYYTSNDPITRAEKYIRSDGRVIW